MRVILLADVRGVGRKNEVKTVADGYGRNFLIARNLAVAADEKGMSVKGAIDAKEEAERARLLAIANKLASLTFNFEVKTGEHKEVFGSISKRDIEEAIRTKGINEGEIILEHPIKSTGEHVVEVNFGKGIQGRLKVVIRSRE